MELRSQCFCIPLQCFPKESFSLVSVRHRVKRGWKADMLWSTQAPSDLCRAASRAEAKWPVFGRRALQASRGSETSSRRYYKALLRGETQVAGPAWRSPGPQLSAGRATSHGPSVGRGSGLAPRAQGRGWQAALRPGRRGASLCRVAVGAWIFYLQQPASLQTFLTRWLLFPQGGTKVEQLSPH